MDKGAKGFNFFRLFGLLFVISISSCRPPSLAAPKGKALKAPVLRDLSFFPINGERFRLSELTEAKALIFVLRDRDCFVSEKYGAVLARLEKSPPLKGLHFIYLYVGRIRAKERAKADLKRFGFQSPYIIDSRQTAINALSAATAADVFIVEPKTRSVLYKGPLAGALSSLAAGDKSALMPKLYNHYAQEVLKRMARSAPPPRRVKNRLGCAVRRPLIKNKVLFTDTAPIIAKKCSVCHNPEGSGPINYIHYEDVAGRSAMFRYVISQDLMPPWFVDPQTGPWREDLSLTPYEKALLLQWIDQGLPGKTAELLWKKPEKKKQTPPGGEPDYIIHLPKTRIPEEGLNAYKAYFINPGWTKDKWLRDFQVFLSPKLSHHILFFIMDPSFNPPPGALTPKMHRSFRQQMTAQWGGRTTKYTGGPVKQAALWPKGAGLGVEIHYESTGISALSQPKIHFNFSDKAPESIRLGYLLDTAKINIPPYASNFRIRVSHKMKESLELMGVSVHMHSRGKASAVYITDSKGVRKRIFALDPYYEKFSRSYSLKKPLAVEKGSILECVNYFDNSSGNPINPNPHQHVRFGGFKWNEMSECFFNWKAKPGSKARPLWITDR